MTEAELFGLTPTEIDGLQAIERGYLVPDEPPKNGETETITSFDVMQHRVGWLFVEMLQGKIAGYRVEMDRSEDPIKFHITTWT